MQNRNEIIKNSTYGCQRKEEKYWFLACLIANEYHQDPEWLDLKEPNGERMSEDNYLNNILFKDRWNKEMKEGLIEDIDEILNNSESDISNLIEQMGAWGGGPKEELVIGWLTNIRKFANA